MTRCETADIPFLILPVSILISRLCGEVVLVQDKVVDVVPTRAEKADLLVLAEGDIAEGVDGYELFEAFLKV